MLKEENEAQTYSCCRVYKLNALVLKGNERRHGVYSIKNG